MATNSTPSERARFALVMFAVASWSFGIWQESIAAGFFCFFGLVSACSVLNDKYTSD